MYSLTIAYSAIPMPMNLNTLFKKVLWQSVSINLKMFSVLANNYGKGTGEKQQTHPYAITTAPSSKASCTVLYPAVPFPPCFNVANLSSKLRLKNGNSEMGGSRISLTKLDTTVLNAAARMSPTATSSTLSRSAKSQKSFQVLLKALRDLLSVVGSRGVDGDVVMLV
jgi:hypothetical protein